MHYDMEEFRTRVRERRESFVRDTVVLLLLLIVAVIVLVCFPETTVTFICVAAIIVSVVLLICTVKKYKPILLYAKEIRGINVKEHEYTVAGRQRNSRWFGRYTLGSSRVAKSNIHSIIYLRLEDGDVVAVDGHMQVHTDLYEIGDELTRYSGAKYLLITGKDVEKNPCPICGTVNTDGKFRCDGCGLGIIQ